MNLIKLFLLAILLGSLGAGAGGAVGSNIGPGGVLGGGFVVGVAFVIASGYLGVRWRWIQREQRIWSILGASFGFALAWMVTLATITVPGALTLSTVLIGLGAVLGAVVGISPHKRA